MILLTRQENYIAAMLMIGVSVVEIARRMGKAPETIESQMTTIYRKAHVVSRYKLVQMLKAGARVEVAE